MSKGRACQHPRTAVKAEANNDLTQTIYTCKKCGKSWVEEEPVLEPMETHLEVEKE